MNKKIVIAGSRSGVGKTTVSLGLMAALKNKGLKVQPYKVGPDYIDPAFHSLICGRTSYNLDSYFSGPEGVRRIFQQYSKTADISLIEGVMGLFDGKGKNSRSSTAEIAKILQAPVVLVIDARKVAQSAAALVYGYKNYDRELNLAGLIINNTSSSRHFKLLKEAIKNKMPELAVLGFLPKFAELELPEQQLGLVPAAENKEFEKYQEKLTAVMEEYIDLEQLEEIAAEGEKLNSVEPLTEKFSSELKNKVSTAKIKIAIASDQAFNFYYQSNLDLLTSRGAEIIKVSPLDDQKLAEVDGFYLAGGFPENFLPELAANQKFKDDLKRKIKNGLPVYAEGGGLLYLCSSIKDLAGQKYKMLDLISAEVEMTSKLQAMGYREVKAVSDNLLFKKGETAKGHVFHYSQIKNAAENIKKSYRLRDKEEGYSPAENILASYLQLYFDSNPKIVDRFLRKALNYQQLKSERT